MTAVLGVSLVGAFRDVTRFPPGALPFTVANEEACDGKGCSTLGDRNCTHQFLEVIHQPLLGFIQGLGACGSVDGVLCFLPIDANEQVPSTGGPGDGDARKGCVEDLVTHKREVTPSSLSASGT